MFFLGTEEPGLSVGHGSRELTAHAVGCAMLFTWTGGSPQPVSFGVHPPALGRCPDRNETVPQNPGCEGARQRVQKEGARLLGANRCDQTRCVQNET